MKCLTKVVKTKKKQRITEILRKDNINIENTKIQNDNEKEENTGRHSILICHWGEAGEHGIDSNMVKAELDHRDGINVYRCLDL